MVMKIKNIADIYPPGKGIKTVFITGVTGQDGSHMVDYLLKNTNAFILGGARRLSVENHDNIKHLEGVDRFKLVNFDLTDSHSIYKLMEVAQPDYFINFAAQSFVASSWDFARQTWATNSTAVLDCLEAIRRIKPTCRFYNAGSSEEFGNVVYEPQDENHPPRPRSPYGASKSGARTIVKVYRESYGLYAVQGWLFNHEGPRRGEEFVTRKITKGVSRIKRALETGEPFAPIELGNLDAKRDWSDAEDMVDGVWRMLNQELYNEKLNQQHHDEWYELYNEEKNKLQMTQWESKRIKDYVCASDVNHSIRQFIEAAFTAADVAWTNKTTDNPLEEKYVRSGEQEDVLVVVNPKFYRPAEVDHLRGNSTAIRSELGWSPKSTFENLVKKMVSADLKR